MPDDDSVSPTADVLTAAGGAPMVFISHDSRDADLAEAFAKLLKSVSAGMIKTFRSSDKKAGDGIEFGDEWYKRLMTKLQSTSDVVCLFTERSLDRPCGDTEKRRDRHTAEANKGRRRREFRRQAG